MRGALTPAMFYGEVVLASMFIPFLTRRSGLFRLTAGAVLATGLLDAVVTAQVIAAFGDVVPRILRFPFLSLTRSVEVSQFIQRIDPVPISVWGVTWFLKTGVLLYVASLGLAEWLNLRDYRPTALPWGAVAVAGSLWVAGNIVELAAFFRPEVYVPYPAVPILVIPLLLVVVDRLRFRAKTRASEEAAAPEAGASEP